MLNYSDSLQHLPMKFIIKNNWIFYSKKVMDFTPLSSAHIKPQVYPSQPEHTDNPTKWILYFNVFEVITYIVHKAVKQNGRCPPCGTPDVTLMLNHSY